MLASQEGDHLEFVENMSLGFDQVYPAILGLDAGNISNCCYTSHETASVL